jgi:hypothetical protein
MKFLLAIAILSLGVVTAASGVAAPTKDDPDALVVRGVDRYKHEDYEGARAAFARAFELSPKTALLFNLALAEVQSGHAVDAVKHFRDYLNEPDADPNKAQIIRTKWLPRAESETGLLRIDAASGTILLVDGELVGKAPLIATVPVAPGDHRVEARRGTFAPIASVVRAEPGVVTPVSLSVPEEKAAAPSSTTAEPAPRRMVEQPSPDPSTAKIVTVAAVGGAAVLAGGIAVLFAISSSGDANRAGELSAHLSSNSACTGSSQPPLCSGLRSERDNEYVHRDLAYGFGITAGAFVAADALLFLLWPRTTSSIVAAPTDATGVIIGWRSQL